MAILRRIKSRLKDLVTTKKKRARSTRKTKLEMKKEEKLTSTQMEKTEKTIGLQETSVEKTKFYTGEIPKVAPRTMPQELPERYGEDKMVAQTRDPWWIHVYWEIKDSTLQRLKKELKDDFYKAKRILRVYDISNIIFDGTNAHRFFDIHINDYANNWYIDTAGPGRSWCVDWGLLLSDGRFITVVRSNPVFTPLEGPSWITDEEWMVPEEIFARLYGMGFGLGRSSPVGKAWQERIRRELFSGILASPGITSVSSPVKIKERKFWLVVNTELIVYGATEPDATVYVQGRKIQLRPDGTFSLRFALPDGKQVIPVRGVSADKLEERTITPIVTKETK
ncbi:MAG: DUF4912 domain-containing protein [Candidatus Omnitrophica bacterium]|nr:DUF4912 domain-containing protein [Candidatus Omnitrophota bacterium]